MELDADRGHGLVAHAGDVKVAAALPVEAFLAQIALPAFQQEAQEAQAGGGIEGSGVGLGDRAVRLLHGGLLRSHVGGNKSTPDGERQSVTRFRRKTPDAGAGWPAGKEGPPGGKSLRPGRVRWYKIGASFTKLCAAPLGSSSILRPQLECYPA